MGNFFAELKRRHIYRVAAAYAVVAWLLIQVVNNLAPMLHLPDWASGFFLVALLIGFPIAVLFAWIHELAPGEGALAPVTTGKLDWALIGGLVIVIALLSYQQLFSSSKAPGTVNQQRGVEAARQAAASPGAGLSVAVLPFENLSGDANQEFFSDGMTAEITSALTKIPDLRVVARTSASTFKGQNRDIPSIAQALHATHLIEGSVRRAGNRVRITAQLIEAGNGTNIWTDSYDREMTDVFAIQEDIARAIAGALRMPLNLAPGERIVSSRTNDSETYVQYLRARVLVFARAPGAYQEVEAINVRDPNFAPAWTLRANGMAAATVVAVRRGGSIEEGRRQVQTLLDNAEMAAQKAIALDPSLPAGYAELGGVMVRRAKWADAETLFQKASALDPDNPEALSSYRGLLDNVGRTKEALAIAVQLQTLEPFAPIQNINNAITMTTAREAAAIAILEVMPPNPGGPLNYNRNMALARAYAIEGQYAKAADTILLIHTQVPEKSVQDAARLMRTAPTKVRAPQDLPALDNELNFVYAHIGAHERIIEYQERTAEVGSNRGFQYLWDPLYTPLRKTERFKAFIRKVGIFDYWRTHAFADLCRPVGADDFVCD